MDIRIIVGLEAHDGSGKSTTAVEISKLFGGSVFFTNEQIKKKRSEIYRDKSMTHPQKMKAVEETYAEEKLEFQGNMKQNFVVLDRTWFSHTVEENVMDVMDRNSEPTYPTNSIPDDVIQPLFVFQIVIPEDERQKRVEERGEELTPRDHRLNDDANYLKCWRQSGNGLMYDSTITSSDPEVCALRGRLEALLGNPTIPPLKLVDN